MCSTSAALLTDLHIIPKQQSFHPWIGSDPSLTVRTLEEQAFNVKALSIITFTAITAISLSVITVSLFVTTPTTTLSIALFFPTLATPGFAYAASKLQIKSRMIEQILQCERSVAEHFEKIKDWPEPQILDFLNNHQIHKNSALTSYDLLPLIARYKAKEELSLKTKEKSDIQLNSSQIDNRMLRLFMRNMGWQLLETETVPAAIEAALALQILKEPTRQCYPSDLFQLTQKSFDERQFDRLYGPDDEYLRFREEDRRPLTLEELVIDLSPDVLRQKLF